MAARIQGEFWWMMKFHYREALTPVPHEVSLERTTKRREDLGKHSVCTTHFLKTEIARFVTGPKLQGLRAEDAKAKPYLVL